MPVRLRCPGCQTAYQLPDTVRGKSVRCKSCSKTFKVPGLTASPTPDKRKLQPAAAATSPGRKAADKHAIASPPKKTRPLPPDDDDDEPRAVARPSKKKKKPKEKQKTPVMLIVALAGGGVALVAVAVVVFMFMSGGSDTMAKNPPKNSPQTPAIPNAPKSTMPTDNNNTADGDPLPADMVVSYKDHVRPLLDKYCTNCHSGEKPKGGASFETYETIIKGGRSIFLVKNQPDKSSIVARVEQKKKGRPMPPKGEPQPSATEKAYLRRWIAAGAEDDSGVSARLVGGLRKPFVPVQSTAPGFYIRTSFIASRQQTLPQHDLQASNWDKSRK